MRCHYQLQFKCIYNFLNWRVTEKWTLTGFMAKKIFMIRSLRNLWGKYRTPKCMILRAGLTYVCRLCNVYTVHETIIKSLSFGNIYFLFRCDVAKSVEPINLKHWHSVSLCWLSRYDFIILCVPFYKLLRGNAHEKLSIVHKKHTGPGEYI